MVFVIKMTLKELSSATEQRPFRPFDLNFSDGRGVTIREPKELGIHPHSETTIIFYAPSGGYEIIDIALIVSLQVAAKQP
jgi:hypothetical protein